MGIKDFFIKQKPRQVTENFHIDEFASGDGVPYPEDKYDTLVTLCRQLEAIRAEIGKPIKITSGYRTEQRNKAVGGVKDSFHCRGMAADMHVRGMTGYKLAEIVRCLIKDGLIRQGGVGGYKNFCHYDIRGTAARWKG